MKIFFKLLFYQKNYQEKQKYMESMAKYDHRTFPSQVSNGHFRYTNKFALFFGLSFIFFTMPIERKDSLVTNIHISDLQTSQLQIILLFLFSLNRKKLGFKQSTFQFYATHVMAHVKNEFSLKSTKRNRNNPIKLKDNEELFLWELSLLNADLFYIFYVSLNQWKERFF